MLDNSPSRAQTRPQDKLRQREEKEGRLGLIDSHHKRPNSELEIDERIRIRGRQYVDDQQRAAHCESSLETVW